MVNASANHSINCYTNETKEIIKKMVKLGGFEQTVYLKGASGIGKSEMVGQLAKELDAELYDIRLGLYDTIDLNGIGIPDIENKLAIFTRPEFLPPEKGNGQKYLIFLDEMNHADEKLLGSAYQITLERRIGTHKLPDNVLIIAAGNTKTDNGIAFTLPSPLVNRFVTINVIPYIDDWLVYAKERNIDWRILSFLKSNPEYLHKFVSNSEEDNFPTPRNWVKLNQFINEFEDEAFMRVIMNGMFGYGTYTVFKEYIELIKKIPTMKDIIKGVFRVQLDKDLSDAYAFSMLASSYVKNNIMDLTVDNIINLFKYIETQEQNKEVMYMLSIEIMTIVNKELKEKDDTKLNTLQYKIFTTNQFEGNKDFIKRLKEFNQSIS